MPAYKLNSSDKKIISRIVGRQHVSTTDDTIANIMRDKLPTQPESTLKVVIRYALKCHGANQDLYRRVMSSRF